IADRRAAIDDQGMGAIVQYRGETHTIICNVEYAIATSLRSRPPHLLQALGEVEVVGQRSTQVHTQVTPAGECAIGKEDHAHAVIADIWQELGEYGRCIARSHECSRAPRGHAIKIAIVEIPYCGDQIKEAESARGIAYQI